MATDHAAILIGRHIMQVEESALHVHWVGDHTLEEQQQIYARIRAYLAERGTALLLFDLTQAGTLTAEHRRASADWWRRQELDSIALAHYGLSRTALVFTSLIQRAVELLTRSQAIVGNFRTEAEARAWLASIQGRLRAKKSAWP